MPRHCTLLLIVALLAGDHARVHAATEPADPPSAAIEAVVESAFAAMHDGWSADEVLLQDDLRSKFLAACNAHMKEGASATDDELCAALLHLRKSGSRLPKSTRRDKRRVTDRVLTAAEIAARQLQDERDCHTDMILVNAEARAKFDEFAKLISPEDESYLLRKAAIQLRKTRRLEPELVSRVTDWHRTIREAPLAELRGQLDTVSEGPGVYIFRDATGYLYIGQAANLRERMKQHLLDSDRIALAKYIAASDPSSIQIELHEFQSNSPATNTRTRRAYESELIRTRKPRLNLAP